MSEMLPEERCREHGARLSVGPVGVRTAVGPEGFGVCGRFVHMCVCSPEQSTLRSAAEAACPPDPAFGAWIPPAPTRASELP